MQFNIATKMTTITQISLHMRMRSLQKKVGVAAGILALGAN